MTERRRARATAVLAPVAVGVLLCGGCGGGDFENRPRPPVTLDITGVITDSRVTVSPDSFGAGPTVLTIANETSDSHTVTLEGRDIASEEVGPINPQDTASLQKTLSEGTYTVDADSRDDVFADGIKEARIKVGPERDSASDDVLLP